MVADWIPKCLFRRPVLASNRQSAARVSRRKSERAFCKLFSVSYLRCSLEFSAARSLGFSTTARPQGLAERPDSSARRAVGLATLGIHGEDQMLVKGRSSQGDRWLAADFPHLIYGHYVSSNQRNSSGTNLAQAWLRAARACDSTRGGSWKTGSRSSREARQPLRSA